MLKRSSEPKEDMTSVFPQPTPSLPCTPPSTITKYGMCLVKGSGQWIRKNHRLMVPKCRVQKPKGLVQKPKGLVQIKLSIATRVDIPAYSVVCSFGCLRVLASTPR